MRSVFIDLEHPRHRHPKAAGGFPWGEAWGGGVVVNRLDQFFKLFTQLFGEAITTKGEVMACCDQPNLSLAKCVVQFIEPAGYSSNASLVLTCGSLPRALHKVVVDVHDQSLQIIGNSVGGIHSFIRAICRRHPILRAPNRVRNDIQNVLKSHAYVIEGGVLVGAFMLVKGLEVLQGAIQAASSRTGSRKGTSNLGYLELQPQHLLLSALVHSEAAITRGENKCRQANNPGANRSDPISGRAWFIEDFEAAGGKPPFANDESCKEQDREPHRSRHGQPTKGCSNRAIKKRENCHVHPFAWSGPVNWGILA